jgi:hypothetical protein
VIIGLILATLIGIFFIFSGAFLIIGSSFFGEQNFYPLILVAIGVFIEYETWSHSPFTLVFKVAL